MTYAFTPSFQTPYELGNGNQTTTWAQCIAFYEGLAQQFPQVLQLTQIGTTNSGRPLHAGVVTADGMFDRSTLKALGRPVYFNNNGIHPGEPEGIDACMALVRDFCLQPERLAALGRTVFLFIPAYGVDGMHNRNKRSRTDQVGPESFGFRGNGRNLDLNRDFIKADSLEAQAFCRFFTAWDPDVMVDTHTSNGADYSYTMTLIHTQSDKLGDVLGPYLRETMLPAIYEGMEQRGWPTCPYVNPVHDSPDKGIQHSLEVPRFSTGYAALHHTVGFMTETHMLKTFAQRYDSMRALVETVLAYTVSHGPALQALRAAAKADAARCSQWPVLWRIDYERPSQVPFKGFKAVYSPSKLGNYTRLSYDRSQPWEHDITFFNRCTPEVLVDTPKAYVIPQAWREVIERLQWNGVVTERLAQDQVRRVGVYRIAHVQTRARPYEGHMFHDGVTVTTHMEDVQLYAGDYLVPLNQAQARFAVETLEPQAHDSFFRWGFFNSVLEKKEAFSDYVFEDTAWDMLQAEPLLAAQFEDWKDQHPQDVSDPQKVLQFIFANGKRFHEPEWMRYPVFGWVD
ncbi:M14 family zinc carboxypeptidase [Rhodoferax aquaticus]|uniref:Peptidase M14 n=1 Tax=Rhodoferax aquaticus TaxID=2527691 RepID=A0A515EM22_9BURK|nr:M14 family zinc carboxypeptidase [Rhodoferax aquaticus]QDL53707.1 peptidase M14 [Rhodoferax aquaticus]